MNLLAVIGAFIMTLAFLAYGIGSITLERFRIIGNMVLIFYSLGLLFEISAILMMIIAATGTVETWHMFVGALAFLIMLINTVWVWGVYFVKGLDGSVNIWLLRYTKAAYFCWVVAYLLGIVLIIWF